MASFITPTFANSTEVAPVLEAPQEQLSYYPETTIPQTHLNLVVVGHVHSGKSTIAGRLLYDLGEMNDGILATDFLARHMGKESSKFAFLMDKGKEERTRGVSIHISYREFSTDSYHYTMIDAPGHRDFMTNSIRAMAQGDVALIVVPATKGDFEMAMAKGDHKKREKQGQTRQHSRLCHLMGVEQIIVCINKMDDESVNWSQERYDQIKEEMENLLTKTGYKTNRIPFIPISGLHGDNLTKRSDHMPWYKGFEVKRKRQKVSGHTLMDALEKVVKIPRRDKYLRESRVPDFVTGYVRDTDEGIFKRMPTDIIDLFIDYFRNYKKKPLRMPIAEVYNIKGVGEVVTGRVVQGQMRVGMKVRFCPTGCTGIIESIQVNGQYGTSIDTAYCGDNVGVCIKGLPMENMPYRGDVMVIEDPKEDPNPPRAVKQFTALVFVQDHPGKLSCGNMVMDRYTGERVPKGGYTPPIHISTASAPCQMTAINWKMGKRSTSNAKVEGVPYIEAGDQAEVVFAPQMHIVVQPFDECKQLGRIAAMQHRDLVMIGKVLKVEYANNRY